MTISRRLLIFLALILSATLTLNAQDLPQDKKTSQDYMAIAVEVMASTRAIDDARDQMVLAANYDTTNIKANFEAGHMHIESIGKELAIKYFLRIYRQNPNYRFDLEYWIGKSYQYGLKFDQAIDYYTRYKNKLKSKAGYAGKDKVEMDEVDRRLMECNNGKEFLANPKPYAITNMGSAINSPQEDYAPVLTADEREIVFTTRRQDENTSPDVADDNKYYEDIFVATRDGANWKSAKNIGNPVNTKYNDSNLTLSPDGSLLFVYKDEGGGDIYVCEKNRDGSWGEPTPLPGIINSSARESSVSITADEKTLYFASERPGGFGGSDIYVCTKDSKGEWSRVKNLGPKINTELDEDGPFISFDAKTLYFSSEAHKGMGGFDIFKIELLNSEKNEWGDPENIGYPVNTPDDDIYFTTSKDGKRSYYASVRDEGLGYTDIYVITAVEETKKQPDVVAKEPVKEPVKEEPIKEPVKEEPKKEEPKKEVPKKAVQPIKYLLNVVDAETKQPLDAKVRMQGLKDKVVVGSVEKGNGAIEYAIKSTAAKDYRITVEKEGYIFQTLNEKIPAATTEEKTIIKTIEMRKLVVNAVSILRNVYFDFEKASFKTDSYGELNRLETMMKQNPNLQVEISGHTDKVGSKVYNKRLSLRRANAVRSFLTSKGVDPRRIKTVGYGEERPIASNDDDKEGRELNRRVEFKVLGN
ncbi:MAG: PD40 domain-containing protein [Bacteroidetes bacterium]|nr:PD40 domain-containing protein [Bacteroidota bacterium]